MLRSLTAAIVIALSSTSTQAEQTQEQAFPRFDSHIVTEGASLTWRNYVKWWNETQGTPLNGDRELASELWAEGVARLKPEYVYTHGVNLVIVRSRAEGHEEGFYVSLAISSGPGPNDAQFTRMLIAHDTAGTVYTFRRRGQFKRTTAKQEKKTTLNKVSGDADEKTEPFSNEAKRELEKLQGKWVLKKAERRGEKFEAEDQKSVLEIKGTKWIFTGQEKGEFIAIYPEGDPKCFDLRSAEEGSKGVVTEGIYKIDGETLTICINEGKSDQRPARFETTDEQPETILTTVFKKANAK